MTALTLSPRTARTTGLLYLAMAVLAVPGFLIIRPMLFDPESAGTTLAHLVEMEAVARAGIGLELALVAVQALVALWFYKLFRGVSAFAAGTLAAFGLINAIAILASAAGLAAALESAVGPSFTGDAAGAAAAAQLMYLLSGAFWGVGALFFGLWLIPMGWLARRSGMGRALGWVLTAGGAAYIINAFVAFLAPAAAPVAEILPYLATIGEVWIIVVLLRHGLRAPSRRSVPDAAQAAA